MAPTLFKRLPFNYENVTEDTLFCDWRITADECFGGQAVAYMYLAHLVFCIMFVFVCGYILFDRIVRRRLRFYEWNTREMAFYPKPTEMFVLMAMIFFVLRAALAINVFANLSGDNMTARESWGNVAWPFAAAAIVFYLTGLIFATPHSYSDIELSSSGTPFLPTPSQLTAIMFTLVSLPFLLNQGLAIAAGFAYDKGDIEGHNNFVTGLYLMWAVFIVVMFSFYIFFGRQLIVILARNIEAIQASTRYDSANCSSSGLKSMKNNVYTHRLNEIKESYRKIRGTVMIIVILMPVVLIVTLSMTFFRVYIMRNHTLSYVFALMWINATAFTVAVSVVLMGLSRKK
ncbi:uncharacterized protein VTP21DRAFT_2140 [Calcarisporiella thermophila]|uniref:uncharacterized protein n=1 Tax=Calcarisporiella thermophila TaxID=911321 RepID=UPI003743CC5A